MSIRTRGKFSPLVAAKMPKASKLALRIFMTPPPPKRAVDPPPAPGHMKGGLPDRKGLITNFIEIKLPVLSPFIHHSEK